MKISIAFLFLLMASAASAADPITYWVSRTDDSGTVVLQGWITTDGTLGYWPSYSRRNRINPIIDYFLRFSSNGSVLSSVDSYVRIFAGIEATPTELEHELPAEGYSGFQVIGFYGNGNWIWAGSCDTEQCQEVLSDGVTTWSVNRTDGEIGIVPGVCEP